MSRAVRRYYIWCLVPARGSVSYRTRRRENGDCPAPSLTQALGTHPRRAPRVAPWTCPLLRTVPEAPAHDSGRNLPGRRPDSLRDHGRRPPDGDVRDNPANDVRYCPQDEGPDDVPDNFADVSMGYQTGVSVTSLKPNVSSHKQMRRRAVFWESYSFGCSAPRSVPAVPTAVCSKP